MIRKELKIEPEEFDKQFLAHLEAETKNVGRRTSTSGRSSVKVVADAVQDEGLGRRHQRGHRDPRLLSRLRRGPQHLRDAGRRRTWPRATRRPPSPSWSATSRSADAIPSRSRRLAKLLEEAGNKKEAAAVLERLNFIYPMDSDAHQQLGDAAARRRATPTGAVREFDAVVANKPIDPAQAHYDLARAYHLNKEDEKAKDELLAALETAPGFRQAQKLLLELSGESGTQPTPVKK